jgi:hypothetical protein
LITYLHVMLLKETVAHKTIVGFKKTSNWFSMRKNVSYNTETAFGVNYFVYDMSSDALMGIYIFFLLVPIELK